MRRALAALIAAIFLAAPPAEAQQPGRTYTVAFVAINPRAAHMLRTHTLPELARAGFVEGRNLSVDIVDARADAVADQARDLAARRPDAILAVAGLTVEALRQATSDIPIVAIGLSGAAGDTLESLARPKDNVTGTIIFGPELEGKRLELLNELAPGAGPIAALLNSTNPYVESRTQMLAKVAGAAGVDLKHVAMSGDGSYDAAFNTIRRFSPRALLVGSDPQHLRDAPEVARLAREAKLPTICHWREMAEAGCLMSYGPSLSAIYRRSGEQLARLLRGARVADIPIEAPSVLELVINLKVARHLGLNVPPALIARAEEVIE
jgi:putative ABC transport system substrate-binding protein